MLPFTLDISLCNYYRTNSRYKQSAYTFFIASVAHNDVKHGQGVVQLPNAKQTLYNKRERLLTVWEDIRCAKYLITSLWTDIKRFTVIWICAHILHHGVYGLWYWVRLDLLAVLCLHFQRSGLWGAHEREVQEPCVRCSPQHETLKNGTCNVITNLWGSLRHPHSVPCSRA